MACKVAGSVEPWQRLPEKVVLVTGASSGLGRELCLDLAKAGCRIIAAARRMDRLQDLCDRINESGPKGDDLDCNSTRAVAVELDISSDGQTIETAVQTAWDAFGHIDVLVNNAGIRGSLSSPLDLGDEEWDRVIRTNLTGTWLVGKHTGIRMRDAGRGGSIINISSVSGLPRAQFPGGIAYNSSKAAVISMTKVMALELGKYNIRVNSIAPGLFESEITKDLIRQDWIKNVALRSVPLQTYGTSDPAMTSLIRYLIHDSSSYVSGNIFIADAGLTIPGFPLFSSL